METLGGPGSPEIGEQVEAEFGLDLDLEEQLESQYMARQSVIAQQELTGATGLVTEEELMLPGMDLPADTEIREGDMVHESDDDLERSPRQKMVAMMRALAETRFVKRIKNGAQSRVRGHFQRTCSRIDASLAMGITADELHGVEVGEVGHGWAVGTETSSFLANKLGNKK
jgi:hypothetical protein